MGGTVVTASGEGFAQGATCVFEDSSLGSAVSQLTTLHNTTCLECLIPALDYLEDINGGHIVHLSVTSVP